MCGERKRNLLFWPYSGVDDQIARRRVAGGAGLGETETADRLEQAVATVIAEGKSVTYDLKTDRNDPTAAGTSQVGDAIIASLHAGG